MAEMQVSKLDVKSHDTPDELRSPNKTKVEVVRLKEFTLGRLTMEPGWKWSDCIKPVVKTDSCQVSHVGHCISGRIHIQMNDGSETTITPGTSYTIPPGHDAWVEGSEPFVCVEVLSAEQFARPA
jgi:hypothetical protein